MNTQNDLDNAEDFDVLRKAVIRKCYNECMDFAKEKWNEYVTDKSDDISDDISEYVRGQSDGATACADYILKAFGLTKKDL